MYYVSEHYKPEEITWSRAICMSCNPRSAAEWPIHFSHILSKCKVIHPQWYTMDEKERERGWGEPFCGDLYADTFDFVKHPGQNFGSWMYREKFTWRWILKTLFLINSNYFQHVHVFLNMGYFIPTAAKFNPQIFGPWKSNISVNNFKF